MSTLLRRFDAHGMLHGSRIGALVFADDGFRLASVGADERVRIWDAAEGVALGSHDVGGFFGDGVGVLEGAAVFASVDGVSRLAPDGGDPQPLFPRDEEWFAADLRSGGARVVALERSDIEYEATTRYRARVLTEGTLRSLDIAVDEASLASRLGSSPHGATLLPNALALSSDGRWLVVLALLERIAPAADAEREPIARLLLSWDLASAGTEPAIAVVEEARDGTIDPSSFAFDGASPRFLLSPDGERVVTAWDEIRVLDRHTGAEILRPALPPDRFTDPTAAAIAFARGGRELVVATSSGIGVLDASTGALLRAREAGAVQVPSALAVSDDASILAVAVDTSIAVHALDTLEPRHAPRDHPGRISAVAVDPRGRMIASADDRPFLLIRRAETGEIFWRRAAPVSSLAFSGDGTRLLASGPKIFEAVTGEVLAAPGGPEFAVCGFTPDDGIVCVDGGASDTFEGRPARLRFGEGPDGRETGIGEGESLGMFPALSADGSTALAQSRDGWFFWDVALRRRGARVDHGLAAVALAPDGALAAFYPGVANRIEIVSRETGRAESLLDLGALGGSVVAWLAGDRLAVGTHDGTVRIYRLSRANLRAIPLPETLSGGHDASILALAGSADGTFLASGAGDGTVALWRIA